MLEALIAVRATPLPDIVVKVPTLAAKEPLESLATMVEAPFAEAAVVRAFAMVPLDIFEALIAVNATPLPEIEVKVPVVAVTTLAAKLPLASLATIVEAPLAEAAVVLAFEMVPLDILLALISVKPAPLPDTAPDIETKVPTLPAKEPLESLATMVEAPFAEAAVVRAFAMVPAEMLDALMLVMVKPAPVKFAADTLLVKVPAPVAVTFAVEILRAATLPV
jgi:predicted dinucleotide-binding enzyme